MAGERAFFELGAQWGLNLLRGAGRSAGRAIASGARNAGRTVVAGAKNLPRAVARRAAVWGRRAGIAGMIGGGAWLLNSLLSGDEDKVNVVSGLGEGGLSSLLFGTAGSQMNIDKFRPSILKFNPVSYVDKQQQKSLRSHEKESTEASNVNLLSSDTSLEYITNLIKLIIRKVDNQSQEIKQTKLNLLDVEDAATASVLISKKINEEQKEIAIATQAGINAVGKTVTKTNNTMTGILKAIKPTSVSDKWGGAAAGIVAAGAGAGGGDGTADSGLSTVGRIVSTAAAVVGLPAALAAKASGGGMTGHEDHEAETPAGRLGQEAIKDLAVMGQFATYTFFNRTEAGAWIHGKILYISKELGNFIDRETNSDFGSKWAELGIDWALTAAFFESVVAAFHAGGLTFAERALAAGHFGRVKLTLNAIKIMETCIRAVNKAPVRLAELLYNLVFHLPSTVSSFFRTIVHPGNTRFANQIKLALKSTDDYIKAYSRSAPRARRMWDDFRWRHRAAPPDVATPEAAPRPPQDAASPADPKSTTRTRTGADGAPETRQPSPQEPARTTRPDSKPEAKPRSTTDATPRRAEPKPPAPETPHGPEAPRRPADPARTPPNRPARPAAPPAREPRPSVATRKRPRVPPPPETAVRAPTSGGAHASGGWRAGALKILKTAGVALDALFATAQAWDTARLMMLSDVRTSVFGINAYSFPIGGIDGQPTWQERLDQSRTLIERHANPFGHDFFANLFQQMDNTFVAIINTNKNNLKQEFTKAKYPQDQIEKIMDRFDQNCYVAYSDKKNLKLRYGYKIWDKTEHWPFLQMFRIGADKSVELSQADRNDSNGGSGITVLRDAVINPPAELPGLLTNWTGFLLRHTIASDEFVDRMESKVQEGTDWVTRKSVINNTLKRYYEKFSDFIIDYIENVLLPDFGLKINLTSSAKNGELAASEAKVAAAMASTERQLQLNDVIGIQNNFDEIAQSPINSTPFSYFPRTMAGMNLFHAVNSGIVDKQKLDAIRTKMESSTQTGLPFNLDEEIRQQNYLHYRTARINPVSTPPITQLKTTNIEKSNTSETNVNPSTEATRIASLDSRAIRAIDKKVDTLIERSDPVPPTRDIPDGGYFV